MRLTPASLLLPLLLALCAGRGAAQTPIRGDCRVADADVLAAFVQEVNPDFDAEIARAFLAEGGRYGLRADIALCQAILETGWFRFDGGTAVTPDQHNYCGLGVTRRGLKGASFDSVELGVRAMMQHLVAYCCKERLDEKEIVDPRFHLVQRGCAPHWEGLANRWAMNPRYADDILRLYGRLAAFAGLEPETAPGEPDTAVDGLWE